MNIPEICPGLSANETLTHLNLSNNNIKSSSVISILTSLYNSNLMELRMACSHKTDDVSPFLSTFLSKNIKISLLDLSSNELGNRFMNSLVGQTAPNSTLEELILPKNLIVGRRIASFGLFLFQTQKLRILTVNGCLIEANGFIEFCNELQRNEILKVIRIQHNPLADYRVTKLSETIIYSKNDKSSHLLLYNHYYKIFYVLYLLYF